MKSIFIGFCLSVLFLMSCSDSKGDEPIITIDSIYVDKVKFLDLGRVVGFDSQIDIYATLSAAPETDLFTFNTKMEQESITKQISPLLIGTDEQTWAITNIEPVYKDHITESGVSEDGIVMFKDGVTETRIIMHINLFASFEYKRLISAKLNLNTKDMGTIREIPFIVSPKSSAELQEEEQSKLPENEDDI